MHFFPIPNPSIKGAEFMQALEATGYAMPFVYTTQVFTGLLLLARKFVALALLLLAPIVFNIILYDLFLNPSGLLIGVIITVIYVALLFENRARYIPLFTN